MTDRAVKPLPTARPGDVVEVVGVEGGRGMRERMISMGLTIGSKLEVVQAGRGPILVSIKGARLAIGQGMAEKILVASRKG